MVFKWCAALQQYGSSYLTLFHVQESEQENLHALGPEPVEIGEEQGRRGGAFLASSGSFTLSSGNRCGSDVRAS